MVFYDRGPEPGQELTDDLFLQTLAQKICERFGYDTSRVSPVAQAISSVHDKEVKSKDGSSHNVGLTFYEALNQKNKKYSEIVKNLQNEAVATLQQTTNDRGREQIYDMLEQPHSATFGQNLSRYITYAMSSIQHKKDR